MRNLLSGTRLVNVAYGSRNASECDVVKGARLIQEHGFICRREKGDDTEVGEG